MEDLNIVLSQLKINKSRNPLGLANKLFRPSHACEDLKIVNRPGVAGAALHTALLLIN